MMVGGSLIAKWLSSVVLVGASLCLAGEGEPVYDPEASAELILDELLAYVPPPIPPTPVWLAEFDLRLGGGYKENVLYSAVVPQDSPFTLVEAEVFVLREAEDAHDIWLYAFGDQRHYTELTRGDNEYTFMAEAHWQYRPSEGSAVQTQASYYYLNQFFDASVSDVETDSFRLVQHDVGGSLAYEARFARLLHAALGGQVHEVMLEDSTDDYRVYEGFLDLKLRSERGDTLGLIFRRQLEDYEERMRRTATGERLEGGTVELDVARLRLYTRTYLDAARRWLGGLTLEARDQTDNGGGYYDFRALKLGLRLQVRIDAWKAGLGMDFTRADYDYRPVDLDHPEEDLLYRNRGTLWLRVERSLFRQGHVFVTVNREDYTSNEELDTYEVLSAVAGLGYSF